MDKYEQAVVQAAMDYAEYQHGLGCGVPLQQQVKPAERKLLDACSDLACENDGHWEPRGE